MSYIDVLDITINNILDTDLIFKDIYYKIEEDRKGIYIYLITKKEHTKQKSTIYYDTIERGLSYLQGIRKALYLMEMDGGNDEK